MKIIAVVFSSLAFAAAVNLRPNDFQSVIPKVKTSDGSARVLSKTIELRNNRLAKLYELFSDSVVRAYVFSREIKKWTGMKGFDVAFNSPDTSPEQRIQLLDHALGYNSAVCLGSLQSDAQKPTKMSSKAKESLERIREYLLLFKYYKLQYMEWADPDQWSDDLKGKIEAENERLQTSENLEDIGGYYLRIALVGRNNYERAVVDWALNIYSDLLTSSGDAPPAPSIPMYTEYTNVYASLISTLPAGKSCPEPIASYEDKVTVGKINFQKSMLEAGIRGLKCKLSSKADGAMIERIKSVLNKSMTDLEAETLPKIAAAMQQRAAVVKLA